MRDAVRIRNAAWRLALLASLSLPACSNSEPPADAPATDAAIAETPAAETPAPAAVPADTQATAVVPPRLFKVNGMTPAWTALATADGLQFQLTDARGAAMPPKSIPVQRSVQGSIVQYSGMDGSSPVSLEIRQQACSVAGASETHDFTASLDHAGSVFRGCADAL